MALADGPKILGLPRPVAIAGGVALLAALGFVLWRRRSSGGSSSSATDPNAGLTIPGPDNGLNPAGDGTAGGMTDNFYITLQEQQAAKHDKNHKDHGSDHPHPHPRTDHDHDHDPTGRRDRDRNPPGRRTVPPARHRSPRPRPHPVTRGR